MTAHDARLVQYGELLRYPLLTHGEVRSQGADRGAARSISSDRRILVGSPSTFSIAATISTVSSDSGSFPAIAPACCCDCHLTFQQERRVKNWPPAMIPPRWMRVKRWLHFWKVRWRTTRDRRCASRSLAPVPRRLSENGLPHDSHAFDSDAAEVGFATMTEMAGELGEGAVKLDSTRSSGIRAPPSSAS